jgi:hypothetical protein
MKKLIESFEKLIPRIQKIGPTGAEIGPLQDSAPPKLTELSTNAAADPVIGEKQVAIAKDLEKFRPEEREKVLIAALARTQINVGHERVYGNIFGSQLAALQILANEGPKTREEGIGYFEEVQKLHPVIHEKRTFDEWVGFIVAMTLVNFDSKKYCITPIGRDFLQYLLVTGLSHNRAG